jgi:hypothetical protein
LGKDLIVGSAGLLGLEESMAAHLAGLSVEYDLEDWLAADDSAATISCLNSASVVAFLRHVVHCEGHSDELTGFAAGESGKSKFRNMPWWDNSIWLPVELEHSGNLKDDATVFVGSCKALLRELRELQEVSQLQLGASPEGYEEMRTDIRRFYSSNATIQLTDADCVRWVWLALRDGAEMAIKEKTVLWAGPG